MTNSELIERAIAPYVGKTLTTKEFQAVAVAAGVALGSALPSDYAGPNRNGNVYQDQLLARSGSGYTVLAPDAIVRKPRNGRSRQSLADALASAQAKIVAPAPAPTTE